MSRFRKKAKSYKTNEDIELEKQILILENAIRHLESMNQDVSVDMRNELLKLKAKLNPNKLNARHFIYNGIEYDSVREARFAEALDKNGIKFDYQVKIELQPPFKLEKESIQDIELVVDFIVAGQYLVDVKGHIQPVFSIKWKMLKHKFKDTKEYFIVQKDSDIQSFITFVKMNSWKDVL